MVALAGMLKIYFEPFSHEAKGQLTQISVEVSRWLVDQK